MQQEEAKFCLDAIPLVGLTLASFLAGVGVVRIRKLLGSLRFVITTGQRVFKKWADKSSADEFVLQVLDILDQALPDQPPVAKEQIVQKLVQKPEVLVDLIANPDINSAKQLLVNLL